MGKYSNSKSSVRSALPLLDSNPPAYTADLWWLCLGTKLIMANSYELQHELSDDTRFKKVVVDALADIRLAAGDGLFTSVLIQPSK
jgi:hypothetical protein